MLNNEEFKRKLCEILDRYVDSEILKEEAHQNGDLLTFGWEISNLISEWEIQE